MRSLILSVVGLIVLAFFAGEIALAPGPLIVAVAMTVIAVIIGVMTLRQRRRG